MQDGILDCLQARLRLEAYLDGADRSAVLAGHLARCEPCLEACLEAALRRPADAPVPAGFDSRFGRLQSCSRAPRGISQYTVAAACALFVALGLAAVSAGLPFSMGRWIEGMAPQALFAVLGCEGVLSLLWFWHVWSEPQP